MSDSDTTKNWEHGISLSRWHSYLNSFICTFYKTLHALKQKTHFVYLRPFLPIHLLKRVTFPKPRTRYMNDRVGRKYSSQLLVYFGIYA